MQKYALEFFIQGFQETGFTLYPFVDQTGTGAEIDLVMDCFKAILQNEIKYAQNINRRDLRGFKDFIIERNCPLGWVVHNGERIEWLVG